jgi:hypothetical protein
MLEKDGNMRKGDIKIGFRELDFGSVNCKD